MKVARPDQATTDSLDNRHMCCACFHVGDAYRKSEAPFHLYCLGLWLMADEGCSTFACFKILHKANTALMSSLTQSGKPPVPL